MNLQAAALFPALLLVSGCLPHPVHAWREDHSMRSEKSVLAALRDVGATGVQRAAVLAAFDATHPVLRRLSDEADTLLAQWHTLDRRDPGFAVRAETLAHHWGELERDRLVAAARFEREVAAALDAAQWERWQVLPALGQSGSGHIVEAPSARRHR